MPELKKIGQYNRLAMQAANQDQTTEALLQLTIALLLARTNSKPLLKS